MKRKLESLSLSGLPRNIASIAGYSPTTHRAYFRDRRGVAVLSSGETFEVTSVVDPDAAPAWVRHVRARGEEVVALCHTAKHCL
jgi:hypothetical protein